MGLPSASLMMCVVGTPAVAEHSPVIVGSDGRSGAGAVMSFTDTLKLTVAPSGLLLQVTVVSPMGKNEPDAWSQVTVDEKFSGQVAVGVAKVTLAPHDWLPVTSMSASSTMSSGCSNEQVASLTVTLKAHSEVLPDWSVATQLTACGEPATVKLEPESGVQLTVAAPPL